MTKGLLLAGAFIAAAVSGAAAQEPQCVQERAAMVETIRGHARNDLAAVGLDGIPERILKAFADTERHRFIPNGDCFVAYLDRPIPIGHGSTISSPSSSR